MRKEDRLEGREGRWLSLGLMALTATLLSACGGGGGGGGGGTPVEIESHNLTFAKRAGGADAAYGSGVATHADGSFVVVGAFEKTAIFGEGEAHETTLTSAGEFDVYVARFNTDGTLAFAKRAGGTGFNWGYGVAAHSDGSFVVTGSFHDSATFGEGEANETVLTSEGSEDVFVARFNADGTLAYAQSAGGIGSDEGNDIATHGDGSFVVSGYFVDVVTFGAGEANETVLASSGSTNVFVARYNADGTLAFAKGAGGSHSGRSFGVATHTDGSFVIAGTFIGTPTFGEGEAQETELVSSTITSMFVACYNADGTLAVAKCAGGSGSVRGKGVATHTDGSFVVTGAFENTATFGLGEPQESTLTSEGDRDTFVAHFRADGMLSIAKRAGGAMRDLGTDIETYADGSFAIVGTFRDTATFGAGEANETMLIAEGTSDVFIAQYDGNGALSFAKQAGGVERDEGLAIATHIDGTFVVTGFFGGAATFDVGEVSETTLTSAGDDDLFVAHYEPDDES